MKLHVCFGILFLYVTGFSAPVQAKDYYFSNFCKSGSPNNLTIQTSSSGANMTGSIKHGYGSYVSGLNCSIVLNPPPGFGIILSVKELRLRTDFSFRCMDTITISQYTNYRWSNELTDSCSYYNSLGYREVSRPMMITFKTSTSSSSTYNKGFHIVYTTYYTPPCYRSDSFKCKSNYICISKRLRCNGVDNCGDGSDEWSSECSNAGTIAGAVVGSIVFVAIVAIIVVVCRRRRVVIYGTTTVTTPQTSTMVYPQQSACPQQGLAFENQTPPPPYGYQQQQVPHKTQYYTQP